MSEKQYFINALFALLATNSVSHTGNSVLIWFPVSHSRTLSHHTSISRTAGVASCFSKCWNKRTQQVFTDIILEHIPNNNSSHFIYVDFSFACYFNLVLPDVFRWCQNYFVFFPERHSKFTMQRCLCYFVIDYRHQLTHIKTAWWWFFVICQGLQYITWGKF